MFLWKEEFQHQMISLSKQFKIFIRRKSQVSIYFLFTNFCLPNLLCLINSCTSNKIKKTLCKIDLFSSNLDVILYALDVAWELCEDAIHESEFLSNLIKDHSSLSMRSILFIFFFLFFICFVLSIFS